MGNSRSNSKSVEIDSKHVNYKCKVLTIPVLMKATIHYMVMTAAFIVNSISSIEFLAGKVNVAYNKKVSYGYRDMLLCQDSFRENSPVTTPTMSTSNNETGEPDDNNETEIDARNINVLSSFNATDVCAKLSTTVDEDYSTSTSINLSMTPEYSTAWIVVDLGANFGLVLIRVTITIHNPGEIRAHATSVMKKDKEQAICSFQTHSLVGTYQQTVQCLPSKTGRFVYVIQNFDILNVTTDHTGILEVNEIEVFILCQSGTYGVQCNSTCPRSCNTSCDSVTGFCLRCREGEMGFSCNETSETSGNIPGSSKKPSLKTLLFFILPVPVILISCVLFGMSLFHCCQKKRAKRPKPKDSELQEVSSYSEDTKSESTVLSESSQVTVSTQGSSEGSAKKVTFSNPPVYELVYYTIPSSHTLKPLQEPEDSGDDSSSDESEDEDEDEEDEERELQSGSDTTSVSFVSLEALQSKRSNMSQNSNQT